MRTGGGLKLTSCPSACVDVRFSRDAARVFDSFDGVIDRRRALVGSVAAALGPLVGCRSASEDNPTAVARRRDVPLRVVLAGNTTDAEAITRGWGAISDLPLDVQLIEVTRRDVETLESTLHEKSELADVVIFPMMFVPGVVTGQVIVPFSDQDTIAIDEQVGELYPALRGGVANYAAKPYVLPLGCKLPALLSVEPIETPESWEQYHQLVDQQWEGRASEPSAPGWAALMFLLRAARGNRWLFNRDDHSPMIDGDEYIETLEQMVGTHQAYEDGGRLTPQDVWDGIVSGSLRGGITFPTVSVESQRDLQVHDHPYSDGKPQVLLDPFSLVISISSNCRQSGAAKEFINWISGGEGSRPVRQGSDGMSEIRVAVSAAEASPSGGAAGSYVSWLAGRLSTPLTLPTLHLMEAGKYYDLLDIQIGRALDGEASAAEALTAVSKGWQQITSDIGPEKQKRAWRRSQGML